MKPIEEIKKTKNLFVKGENSCGLGGSYYDSVSNKYLNFIFSSQLGWEQLSVSTPSKTPTWDHSLSLYNSLGVNVNKWE